MSSLILNMTKSSKPPVRNHQHPQSMTVFLMHLLSCWGAAIWYTTQYCHIMAICDVKFDTKDYSVHQNSIQEPSMSSKYDCVLGVLIIMLGSCKFEYNSGMTNYLDS